MVSNHTTMRELKTSNMDASEITQENVGYAPEKKSKLSKKAFRGEEFTGREFMTDRDWDAKFELLLSEDLIEAPPIL